MQPSWRDLAPATEGAAVANDDTQQNQTTPAATASAKDPLSKLNLIGRSLFRTLLAGSSSTLSVQVSNKRALSAERSLPQQQPQPQYPANSNRKCCDGGRSSSQNELTASGGANKGGSSGGAGEEERQVRANCCMPLSHLMMVPQQQQRHPGQPEAKAEVEQAQMGEREKSSSLGKLVRLIRDKKPATGSSAGRCTGGWPPAPKDQEPLQTPEEQVVMQQPRSRQGPPPPPPPPAPPQVPVSPAAGSSEAPLPVVAPNPPEVVARSAWAGQRTSGVRRALSKGSATGSRWQASGNAEQKLDRMGKLIALLDEQNARRTNTHSSLLQQSNGHKSTGATSGGNDDELFRLEESWRSFVKLPSLSSATLAAPAAATANENANANANENVPNEVQTEDPTARWTRQRATLKIQQDAIWELLSTEVFYIKRLKVVLDLFMATLLELQQQGLLLEVFSNVAEIYEANYCFWAQYLHPMLAESRSTRHPLEPTRMRNAFVQIGNIFNPYHQYCLDHRSCLAYLKEQNRNNELFKVYLAWCESQRDCERLRLVDLLAKPMQRLTRYSLLLKAIAKKTELESDLLVLEQMIAHMNRFVLTVDLRLRRQEELELLANTVQRLDSMELGLESVYNDEVGRLIKSLYCRLDLTSSLFNCPFKCHRQLLYDSQLHTRGLQLGQIRFKDAQAGGKLDVVLLLFTDHLFICKQLAPTSRWHHHRNSAASQNSGATSGGGSTGGGGGGGVGGLWMKPTGMATPQPPPRATQLLVRGAESEPMARPRAGSHQLMGLAQTSSLRVGDQPQQPQHQQQHQVIHQQIQQSLSPRALSLILSSGIAHSALGGLKPAGSGNDHLSPNRATSQTCVSLNVSPKNSLSLHHNPNLSPRQYQHQLQAGGGRKSSGPASQRTSFHASSSSLVGNAARDFFRRSADSSRSGDNNQPHELSWSGGSQSQQQTTATTGQQHPALGPQARLRLIRSPYPVERLVMHELKGGQAVLVCQLNDSATLANSFVLYCSPPAAAAASSSSTQTAHFTSGAAAAASSSAQAAGSGHSRGGPQQSPSVKRSSSDQPPAATSASARSSQTGNGQHLRLAQVSSQNQESSRSDSESQPASLSPRDNSDSLSAGPATSGSRQQRPTPVGPARQLINLVKQAQARLQLAATFHGVHNLASFAHLDASDWALGDHHLGVARGSRLGAWSSFRQTRRSDNDTLPADKPLERGERVKLMERRSVSSETTQPAAAAAHPRKLSAGPRPATPTLSKALQEQQQSMLLNHGQFEADSWLSPSQGPPRAPMLMAQLAPPGGSLEVGGSGQSSRLGSQGSVFNESELGGGGGAGGLLRMTLQAPPVEQHRSFSSPASPQRRPSVATTTSATEHDPVAGTRPYHQQLLSPNRYPMAAAQHNGGKSTGSGGQRRCSSSSNRRHFSRSSRVASELLVHQAGPPEAPPPSARHSPLSANDSSKSAMSPGTSFTSSDSEFSTRSSSPYVVAGRPGSISQQSSPNHCRYHHPEAVGWTTSGSMSRRRPVARFVQQQLATSSASDFSEPQASQSASEATCTGSGRRRNSRRNLSSLRRQNVILSASSDQQPLDNSLVLNGRRPSDIVMLRERQQLTGSSWPLQSGHSSRDEPLSTISGNNSTSDEPAKTNQGHLLPSSARHRQFLAHHAHYHNLTSSSQATTVDQTNSAVFDSGDQMDPPPATADDHLRQDRPERQQLSAASSNNSATGGGSASFELGQLGKQNCSTCQLRNSGDHHHHHRNSCLCNDNAARSASMETRSPISVTLTLPNQLEAGQLETGSGRGQVSTPVYLSIPRSDALLARRALLSPIDSVAATSPNCDDHTTLLPEHADQSWAEHQLLTSGDDRPTTDLNINISMASSFDSDFGDHRHLMCRRSSSAAAGSQDLATKSQDELAAASVANQCWPEARMSRRSSSTEELPVSASGTSTGSQLRSGSRLGTARERGSFLLRLLPRLKRRYGYYHPTGGSTVQQSPAFAGSSNRYLWQHLSQSSHAPVQDNTGSPRGTARAIPRLALSETSASEDDDDGSMMTTSHMNSTNHLQQQQQLDWPPLTGSAGDLLTLTSAGFVAAHSTLNLSNSSFRLAPSQGYLGFHEKLRLHNLRQQEEEDRALGARRRHSALGRHGRAKRWHSNRKSRLPLTGGLSWHSASTAADLVVPEGGRSLKSLSQSSKSFTGELFDSLLRAASLRSVSSGGRA